MMGDGTKLSQIPDPECAPPREGLNNANQPNGASGFASSLGEDLRGPNDNSNHRQAGEASQAAPPPSRGPVDGSGGGSASMDAEEGMDRHEEDRGGQPSSSAAAAGAPSSYESEVLEQKLHQLLERTDDYSRRISGEAAGSEKKAHEGGGRESRYHAVSEQEEDAQLLKEAEASEIGADESSSRITEQPECIKNGTMKPYQLEGLNWLFQLFRCNVNGILADEMGLGKTLQSIAILGYLNTECNYKVPHIVIAPKSTLTNWANECSRWCPALRTVSLHGSQEDRDATFKDSLQPGSYDVVLTTFEIVIREKSRLKKIKWGYLVLDEAHRIKNEKSVLSGVVRMFQTERRLLITGTPLQNNLRELWALLNFLMPQLFDSSSDFDALFDFSRLNSEDQQTKVIKTLHRILRPFMLRRLKQDVERELPPKREIYVYIGLSKLQKELYAKILSKSMDVVNGMTGNKMQMLNVLMQLRKCCNHPYLFDGVEPGPPFVEGGHLVEAAGKMVLLDKLLPKLKQQGSRVLLFSQMTRVLDIVDDYIRWRGYEYCRIDGSTGSADRQERIDTFNAPDSSVFIFLLSTRAGGLGINLATADVVILFDSDFNPQMDLQAMDRAHRIGQKKTVHVYRFVTEKTVEEKIVERAAKKLKIDSLIIQKGRFANHFMGPSKDELTQMIQFGAQEVFRTQDSSSISDEDIDAILATADQRTAEIEGKLSSLSSKLNLGNLSLDGGLHMFDVAPWDEGAAPAASGASQEPIVKKGPMFIDLGDRKRVERFPSLTKSHRQKDKGPRKPRSQKKGWRTKAGGGYDFQFFNTARLDELDALEQAWLEHTQRGTTKDKAGGPSASASAAAASAAANGTEEAMMDDGMPQPSASPEPSPSPGIPPSDTIGDTEIPEPSPGSYAVPMDVDDTERDGRGPRQEDKKGASRGRASRLQRRQSAESTPPEEAMPTYTGGIAERVKSRQFLSDALDLEHRSSRGGSSVGSDRRSSAPPKDKVRPPPPPPAAAAAAAASAPKSGRKKRGACLTIADLTTDQLRKLLTEVESEVGAPSGRDYVSWSRDRLAEAAENMLASDVEEFFFTSDDFDTALEDIKEMLRNGRAAELQMPIATAPPPPPPAAAKTKSSAADQPASQESEGPRASKKRRTRKGDDQLQPPLPSPGGVSARSRAGRSSMPSPSPPESVGQPARSDDAEGDVAAPPEFKDRHRRERERLIAEGFSKWKRSDFNAFILGCSQEGRTRLDLVAKKYLPGKKLSEVRRYASVFFQRYTDVADGERQLQKIRKGEADIERVKEINECFKRHVALHGGENPHTDVRLPDKLPSDEGFTADEDRYILCAVNECGFGNWLDVQAYFRQRSLARFNWWLLSRQEEDIEKRATAIARALQLQMGRSKKKKSRSSHRGGGRASEAGTGTGSSRKTTGGGSGGGGGGGGSRRQSAVSKQ